MAKHPHKLLLINNKTWKCILEGCNFFVHIGLAHVLPGKQAICWNCDEQFMLDTIALRDDKPVCADCRTVTIVESAPIVEMQTETGRTPEQQKAYDKEMTQMFGKDWRKLLEK